MDLIRLVAALFLAIAAGGDARRVARAGFKVIKPAYAAGQGTTWHWAPSRPRKDGLRRSKRGVPSYTINSTYISTTSYVTSINSLLLCLLAQCGTDTS